MPLDRFEAILRAHVADLESRGTAKGKEVVVTRALRPTPERGPRFLLEGEGEREFLRMNSNSYLGLSWHPRVREAEERGVRDFGAGPGAVRFISGSYAPHLELEARLAAFHQREAAMIFSSAYAAILGTLVSLIDGETVVISDELNHNCIINAMRLARPAQKVIYPHLDLGALERALDEGVGRGRRAVVVTDGVFSMRGVHAPLDRILEICRRWDQAYPENVILVVDDSHGVGAFGLTGRGTEEYTGSPPVDLLVGTLGKAFGVNGGYVVSTGDVIRFLRESAPTYIYSNPITVGEAAACVAALEVVDSPEGRELLARVRSLTRRFEVGLVGLGLETLPGEHPVVPLMVRDTARTRAMVAHLFREGILATGLTYPVVPRGDESIRFQVNADHSEADIDRVLEVLGAFPG